MFQFSFLTFMVVSSLILLSQGGTEYQIFYTYPGCDKKIPLELDSDVTVGDAMKIISEERTIAKGYEMKMSFKGDVLLEAQSFADAGIGADAVVDIIPILLTSIQQIFNAFENTNLKYILRLREDGQNCSNWQSFVKCDETGNPITISIDGKPEFEGAVDFSLLPDIIESIDIGNSSLCGTVDLMNLPRNLKSIHLVGSHFKVDLSRMNRDQWPPHLKQIYLGKNELIFGRLDCSQLPRSLTRLYVSDLKRLDIGFNDMPPQLEFISMSFCILKELYLRNPLPQSLKKIVIHETAITGEIKLQGIRNSASLEFRTSDTEMRERMEKVARVSEVNVKLILLHK